jgi:hypothetical protein
MVLLEENSIKSMVPGRFFRDHKAAVNSLDFHHTEDVMVTVGACPPAVSWVFSLRARVPPRRRSDPTATRPTTLQATTTRSTCTAPTRAR